MIVAGLYLPNGNPRPGPKFDYKLAWFAALHAHAAELLASKAPVVLAGDFNVMPTELDVYKPERWLDDALFAPEVRAAYAALVAQGWTDAIRKLHPEETHLHLLEILARRRSSATRACASTICCSAPSSPDGWSRRGSTASRAAGTRPATMPRRGSS